jgi:hypothetical protein
MASYRGHLTFSTALGLAYGGAAAWYCGFDWWSAALGAGLTAISGLLPDLDSDSGKPVRWLFGVAAVVVPLLLLRKLLALNWPLGQLLAVLGGLYLFIHYALAELFKRITVHRGMFHSLPAMLIAGVAVFLLYHDPRLVVRYYLAAGVMLGFLSHLVLDELCSVNLVGVKLRLNKFAGSALKLKSPSLSATLATYLLLGGLLYLALPQLQPVSPPWRQPSAEYTRSGGGVERMMGTRRP